MHNQHNIESIHVNKFLPKNKNNLKNYYFWADGLFFGGKISAQLLHTLKAIIACYPLDRPTIKQINAARTKSASRKFAQSNEVTERTIRRHIQALEKLGYIEVARTRDVRRNQRNAYTIRVPDPVLSCRSEDIMTSSLTLATSDIINNTKTDQPEAKKATKLCFVFNKIELAILATFINWGTSRWKAVEWIRKYTVDELQGGINYMNSKRITGSPGGYMKAILDGLDKRKKTLRESKYTTRGPMATEIYQANYLPEKKADKSVVLSSLAFAREQNKKHLKKKT